VKFRNYCVRRKSSGGNEAVRDFSGKHIAAESTEMLRRHTESSAHQVTLESEWAGRAMALSRS